ncbi:MAG: PA14 domain protein [Methanocella sp. PtaU1.Bin125]|nr:MAG: PA14 domain protein [Methanocella sp. PtaU1.Bin125]
MTPVFNDSAISEAFYTVLSAGIVVLAGLAISAIVLGMAGQQSKAVAEQAAGIGGAGMTKGLLAFYYTVDASGDLPSSDPDRILPGNFILTRTDPGISLDRSSLPGNMPASGGMVVWAGYMSIPEPGEYTFRLESSDGSWLWVDGALVADNHGIHPSCAAYSAPVYLSAGCHAIKAKCFYTNADCASCRVSIGTGGTWSVPAFYR